MSGTTKDLTGLTPGTSYTYSAYSDSECRTSVATASSFTTLAQLTTSNLTARGVTLNLAGHTGAWWYKSEHHAAQTDLHERGYKSHRAPTRR